MATPTTPPWKQKKPKAKATKMTQAQREEARQRALAAGRRYPNLIDNMAVLKDAKR